MASLSNITGFFQDIEPVTTRVVGALLILFIGFIAGRIVGMLVKRLLNSINLDKNLRRAIGQKMSLEKLIGQIVSLIIYAAAIIMTLNHLGLTTVILTIITAAIIILLILSLLLAVRDLLPNLFAGMAIKYRRDFKVGDTVKVRNVRGKVSEISLLQTMITSGDDVLVLPNAVFQREGFQVKR